MRYLSLLLLMLTCAFADAQTFEELFDNREYSRILASIDTIDQQPLEDIHLFARAAHERHRDSLGLMVLKRAHRRGDANSTTYFEMGRAHFGMGQYVQAAEMFRKSRRANPDLALSYFAEADAYDRALIPDSALAVYHEIVNRFDDRKFALFRTCEIPTEEGYIDSARACWKETIELYTDPTFRRRAQEQLLNIYWHIDGDKSRASEILSDLIETYPEVVKYRLESIQIHAELDDWSAVNADLEYLRNRFNEGTLPSFYTTRNAIPIIDIMGENYRVQIFEILEVRPNTNEFKSKWTAYLTTPLHGVLRGTWKYIEDAEGARIEPDRGSDASTVLEAPLTLEEFVSYMKRTESNF